MEVAFENGCILIHERAPGCGDQRKSILRDIAVLTGGKAITGDLDVQLKNISDLGQARKITIDKNYTIGEGRVQYEPLSFGLEPYTYSNAHTSLLQSSGILITQGTYGILSFEHSLDRLVLCGHSDCEVMHHTQADRSVRLDAIVQSRATTDWPNDLWL